MSPMGLAQQRILVVDDSPTNLRMVERILESEGFAVLTATDGASALHLAASGGLDLILLDVLMPGESGFEVCARLKAESATADVPILFLSALDDVKSKVQGFAAGGVDYVSKPVHSAELLARVRVHLRIRQGNLAWAREQRTRLEALREAQRAILVRPEEIPGARFAVRYESLDGAGGDFYEVFESEPGVYAYFVADVSGHGVSAAFITSAIKALLHQCSGPLYTEEDTMRSIDRVMKGILSDEQYLTACFVRYRPKTGKLRIVNAGHPPMLLTRHPDHLSGADPVEIVDLPSDPLGIHAAAVLQHRDLSLHPGDRFFLYTDGLIEAQAGAGRRRGLANLAQACADAKSLSLSPALDQILAALQTNPAQPREDDILLLGAEAA